MSTSGPTVVVAEDDAALARLVAERVVAIGSDAIATRGSFSIALSGGTTPKAAYALLASPPLRHALEWSHVRFFFGDERCVPPDHADSNYRMAREAMLLSLGITDVAIFRMHGENVPADAATAYAHVLRERLGDVPTFDLVMLGMGPDGHTASLFPGTDPTVDDASLVRAPYVDTFSTYRLTLTPRVINAARHVAIAVSGDSKSETLREVLEGDAAAVDLPVRIVDPVSGELTWLVDRAAAARLRVATTRMS